MKTISVKEAAEALGVSPRAIQYKLQNGDLKGTRTKNQYGVAEWRVWPTKEIADALSQKQGGNGSAAAPVSFAPTDDETVEVEEVTGEQIDDEGSTPASWRQVEIERLEIMAEKLVKPLAERIEAQAVALREQEKVIEDQNRQLRLLPDLQRQAEDERKAAELRALEVEALNKQIAALEEDRQEKVARLEKVSSLETQVAVLNEQLQNLQKPWWKKMFGAPADDKKT